MICPDCNKETISKIKGSSLVIECPSCGWSIATSYIDPIFEDETTYKITVAHGNIPSKESLKAISSIIGGNFIAAKRALETPGGLLMQGKAPEVKGCIENLAESNVAFFVDPPFPYQKDERA